MSKKNKKGVPDTEILRRYSGFMVPVSVLRKRPLTTYEALVVYLKDDCSFNYHNIAVLLDRNERGVRIVYLRAGEKLKKISSEEIKQEIKIPILALRKRPLTTYEALILYLRDNFELNYHDISVLLGRDERDVRKVYFRAKDKLKNG